MANNNGSRLLYLGLSAALSVSLCAGQETAAPPLTAKPNLMPLAPPNPPKVTCAGDQLTVLADNSTIASILTAIHQCTGVKIDIPEGAGSSRIFDQIGPGPAREVLTSLLNGSDYNYVIESSEAEPEKVAAVLLLSRTADKDKSIASAIDPSTLTPARRLWLGTQKNGRPTYSASGAAASSDGTDDSPATDDTPAPAAEIPAANVPPPPPGPTALPPPEVTPPPPPSATDATADIPPNTPPEKVTEEKINSMQQLFEQRRQMIENQNAPPKPQ